MEYQNIINFLGNTPNRPTKFRTKNWAMMHVGRITPMFKLDLKLHC